MSGSLVYHGFSLRGYKYVNTNFDATKLTFPIHRRRTGPCYPDWGSRHVVCKGTIARSFRAVPLGLKLVFIELPAQRVLCEARSALTQVQIGFADRGRSYTRQFERYVLEMRGKMTIQDVARDLKMNRDAIKDIQKRDPAFQPSQALEA